MSMEVNGSRNYPITDYAGWEKEKQSLGGAVKVKDTEVGPDGVKASKQHDEYISSEKKGGKPAGLYRLGQDENGNRKIYFDNPQKPEEKCIGNTDKVDREIKVLKEKKQKLEQKIRSASGDEEKVKEWKKMLEQTEKELSRKDNDAYRRANSEYKNDGRPGGGEN